MMTEPQKHGVGRFAGVIRLIVSVVSLAWIAYLLISAPWSRGGQFLLGYLAVGIVPVVLICALLPDGIRQVLGKAGK